jgi:phenylpropionate dioxygenase-like ring-hydroxylating dioxygenase large terminal subunit
MVCAEGRGNTERFVCPYHGWSYDTAGTLQAVPFASGTRRTSSEAAEAVPRVANYRGFIFASLAQTGDRLENFLGPAEGLVRRFRRPRARAASSRSRAACSSTPTTATGS